MNSNIFTKLTVAITTIATTLVALSFVVIEASPVQAATITYDFDVNITSGLLDENVYEGFFSYDDSTLTGIGREKIGVAEELSIVFEFFGKTYTEADDNNFSFNFPFVEFNENRLVGLQYIVNDTPNNSIFAMFSDDPDGLGGGDRFQYIDVNSLEVNEGSVTFYSRPPSTPIPEPSSVAGLALLGFGWFLRKKVAFSQRN